LLRQEFDRVFQEVDILATPVTPNLPFTLGQKTTDPLAMYLEDVYTVSANLVGIPGVSIPCGFAKPADGEQELPVGLQLLGPMFGEETILRTARFYQEATDWHNWRPPLIERVAKS
jgi:aspartyl-tRNA(Asn)/glutamyl-tRNA(Gln) amidotransferase subunit A